MNIISLFSGAGGMDLGFQKAGFNLIWANEYDKHIWATHEHNFDSELNKKSILDLSPSDIPNCLGLIGGPPCQSFSLGGAKKGTSDPRGQLFWEYIRVLELKKPLFFVAENVVGLLSPKHEKDVQAFLSAFKAAGYNVNVHKYTASDYDVAQDRQRVIMVGYREDLNQTFSPPQALEHKKTMKDIIYNMTSPHANKYDGILDTPNHEYMTGGFSSMFMSRNRVRAWAQPSFTILATARQTPLHPQAPSMQYVKKDTYIFAPGFEHLYRRLSVRECARIQSFPDDFLFLYDKIEHGYKMVGNAVPVNLAFHIAQKIKSDLHI